MTKVSLLIPCYNEEASLPLLREALVKTFAEIETAKPGRYAWEVLLINDGSRDRTLEILRQFHLEDARFCYIDLSRNFGKENAMMAGFDYVTGDCTVVMDADLQHPPVVIGQMLEKWEEGFEDVYAKRITRGREPWLRKKLSLLYYDILTKHSRVKMLHNVGDFRLLDRRCIETLKKLRETERYTKGLFCWIGYQKTYVEFEPAERVAGESSWNFWGLLKLGLEGIISFTTFPLKIATVTGVIFALCAFLYLIWILISTIIWGDPVAGYPTLISVILFIGGLQLICIGMIGEYLARTFNEVKNRPVYIAREHNGKRI